MTTASHEARWDDFAELWLEERPQRLWRLHSDAVNRTLLAAWLPPVPGRVLKTDLFDEVASVGLVPSLLARAEEVVGIDVSERVVEASTRANPGLVALRADVRRLPFADAFFDCIVSNSTLDHLSCEADVAQALSELARVLAPGGHLVLTLDNPLNPAVALRRAIPGAAFDRIWRRHPRLAVRVLPERVRWTCGSDGLKRLLHQAGLTTLEVGAVLHAPRALAVVVADALDGRSGRTYLRALDSLESLGRLPTRAVTGHFVAAHAQRPPGLC